MAAIEEAPEKKAFAKYLKDSGAKLIVNKMVTALSEGCLGNPNLPAGPSLRDFIAEEKNVKGKEESLDLTKEQGAAVKTYLTTSGASDVLTKLLAKLYDEDPRPPKPLAYFQEFLNSEFPPPPPPAKKEKPPPKPPAAAPEPPAAAPEPPAAAEAAPEPPAAEEAAPEPPAAAEAAPDPPPSAPGPDAAEPAAESAEPPAPQAEPEVEAVPDAAPDGAAADPPVEG